jgi:hypothetical protein
MPPQTAKEMGTEFPQWKLEQKLFWNDQVYDRHSEAYQALITGLYDAAYEQDPTFKTDLLALGDAVICHSIGKSDPMDTVLTEAEFVYHLNRLRERILI